MGSLHDQFHPCKSLFSNFSHLVASQNSISVLAIDFCYVYSFLRHLRLLTLEWMSCHSVVRQLKKKRKKTLNNLLQCLDKCFFPWGQSHRLWDVWRMFLRTVVDILHAHSWASTRILAMNVCHGTDSLDFHLVPHLQHFKGFFLRINIMVWTSMLNSNAFHWEFS